MKKRSLPLCILLSICTFGIYFIIWFYFISKEVINEVHYRRIDSPGLNVLFLILGNVLYLAWWNYKISMYLASIEAQTSVETDFWMTPLSIVYGLVLHQSRINRILAAKFPEKKPTERKRVSSSSSSGLPRKSTAR